MYYVLNIVETAGYHHRGDGLLLVLLTIND